MPGLPGMEDPFELAIDEILRSAGGDMRQALRAVLIENFRLQAELTRRDGLFGDEENTKLLLH
jgi:hypothetical protein